LVNESGGYLVGAYEDLALFRKEEARAHCLGAKKNALLCCGFDGLRNKAIVVETSGHAVGCRFTGMRAFDTTAVRSPLGHAKILDWRACLVVNDV
jgi:hypothetical protein